MNDEKVYPVSFGDRLRNIIKEMGVSDAEFARRGGITKQTLAGYIANKREPSREKLARWVLDFNLDAHWLLTGEARQTEDDSKGHEIRHQPHITQATTPRAEDIRELVDTLRQVGATDEEIKRAVLALVGVKD